jgi:hypothetical protein
MVVQEVEEEKELQVGAGNTPSTAPSQGNNGGSGHAGGHMVEEVEVDACAVGGNGSNGVAGDGGDGTLQFNNRSS